MANNSDSEEESDVSLYDFESQSERAKEKSELKKISITKIRKSPLLRSS